MSMEKTGDISPRHTPDTEDRLAPQHDKLAAVQSVETTVAALDDDLTHRLADSLHGLQRKAGSVKG